MQSELFRSRHNPHCIQSPVPARCVTHLYVKTPEEFTSHPSPPRENVIYKTMLVCHCVDVSAYGCDYCIAQLKGGPEVESLEEASGKKKELLSNVLKELSASKSEAEDRIQSLKIKIQHLQWEGGHLSGKVSRVFMFMKKHMEAVEKKVLSEISRQVEEASGSYQDEIREVEAKKDELSKKMAAIEELCSMSDPMTVLDGLEPEDGGGNQQGTTEDCPTAARDLDEGRISEVLHTGLAELVATAHGRLFMNHEESNILLDENTMGNNLLFLPYNQTFIWTERHKPKPKTPGRFRDPQVLSSTSFSTGRHFWTVETSKSGNWRFGVSYGSIARKGFRSYIGCNDKSWGLCKWNQQFSAMHACKVVKLPDTFTCQRFGVYLDYEAGHLSFYELCNPIRHLHTFNTIFTEPLHGVFRLWLDSDKEETWMSLNLVRTEFNQGFDWY